MDYLGDLQRIAMAAVESPTYDDFMRRIRRWFSKEFHVPLPQVDDLEDEYLLLNYFETQFEDLEPEERRNKILELIETEVERKARKTADQDFEDELLAEMEEEFKASKKAIKPDSLPQKNIKSKNPEPIEEDPEEVQIEFLDD